MSTVPQQHHWMIGDSLGLCCRPGVPSATSSKAWWKTSTTALSSVWTVRGITRRRIQYLVRAHRLWVERVEPKRLDSAAPFLFSATRIQFLAIEIARNREGYNSAVFQAKQGAPSGGASWKHPPPTRFVSTVKFYCANSKSCLFSNNVDVAWICL